MLDHLGVQEAYVGGLSMGGGIATRFTVLHPRRVAALLVIDSASASGQEMPQETRCMREELIRLAETEGMRAVRNTRWRITPTSAAPQRPEKRGNAFGSCIYPSIPWATLTAPE